MRYVYNQQPMGLRIDAKFALDDSHEARLRDTAWGMIVRGEIETNAFLERLDEEERKGASDEALSEIFASLVTARRRQQSGWTEEQAKPQLTTAFEALEAQGILCRQNFSCCGTCAASEIYNERGESRSWRGYLWYHAQDLDGLIEDGSTHVGYGVFADAFTNEASWFALESEQRTRLYRDWTVGLMKEVVIPTLERHGVGVDWNGDLAERIRLDGVDFYARLPET